MTEQRPLSNKVAVITGAAKGIGKVTSEYLARDGAHIALIGRDQASLQEWAEVLDKTYPYRSSLVVQCDVTNDVDVKGMADRVADHFGGIDILVNTAGGTGPIETPAQEYDPEEFRRILELNVIGTFLPCKHSIPYLKASGEGRIVNIAGTSGLRGYPNRIGYSSSKWAVRGLTRTLAAELGPYNITVNDVCPNVTNGARMDRVVAEKARKLGKTTAEVHSDFASQTALGRFVDETDVAAAINFLVSGAARNITGHDIPVDAGWKI